MPDVNLRGNDVRLELSSLTLALTARGEVDRAQLAKLRPRLQGVLLERVDQQFAERVHTLSTNPYSQHLITAGGAAEKTSTKSNRLAWRVNVFDADANEHILKPLLSTSFDGFSVRSSNIDLSVESKELTQVSHKRLVERFYEPLCSSVVTVRFLTPTAFKQRGGYVFWPEPRLVMQSLALKYSTVFDGGEPGADLVEELGHAVKIVRYSVRSQQFHLDGARIPGFVGTVSFQFTGAPTLKSYAAMLMLFGEFSGCGIKTSMGMGGMKLLTDLAPGRAR